MSVADHFGLVASVHDALRTTDEAPVRRIRELLPDRRVIGLDIGCGTGRYSRLLRGVLHPGSVLVASDVSAAMLAELKAGDDGHEPVLALRSTAEQVPVRTGSLDLVTAFNSVHHFDLERFLAVADRVLKPNGQLFIYTRTPEQNARTIWGRYFPGFAKREQRLHSEATLREAVRRTSGLELVDTRPSTIPARARLNGSGPRPRAATTRPSPCMHPTSCARPSPSSWAAWPAPRCPGSTSTSWSSPAAAGGTGGGGRSSRRPPPQSRLRRWNRSPHRPGRHTGVTPVGDLRASSRVGMASPGGWRLTP